MLNIMVNAYGLPMFWPAQLLSFGMPSRKASHVFVHRTHVEKCALSQSVLVSPAAKGEEREESICCQSFLGLSLDFKALSS